MNESLRVSAVTRLKEQPETFVDWASQDAFSIPLPELEEIQIAAASKRFSDLFQRIPMLETLAQGQSIKEIRELNDLAPLLVPHSAYKSYPLSVLENGRFDRLTRWLDGLTSFDLSRIDASKCESIDDWIDLIDAQTDIRLVHSSGTSGKLSFLPRSEQETAHVGLDYQLRLFEGFGEEQGLSLEGHREMPVVYPSFRHGAMGQNRRIDAWVKFWHRGRDIPVVTLYPGRISADALSLGGRLSSAEALGESGRLKIAPKLLAQRAGLLKQQQTMPERYEAFLDALEALRGRRVYLIGLYMQLYDAAIAGAKRGIKNLFSSDSLIIMAGGTKGRTLPANWREIIEEFVGCSIRPMFGMSEIMAGGMMCRYGYYHLQPWIVQFLLDPRTGNILPRHGTQTGRLGVFDLSASTYWGGFLTGDEATIHWGDREPCACGRVGPHLDPDVRRYTEKEGGDDKITCAGAPDAHDKALDFILQQVGG